MLVEPLLMLVYMSSDILHMPPYAESGHDTNDVHGSIRPTDIIM